LQVWCWWCVWCVPLVSGTRPLQLQSTALTGWCL
jgi:hypothetical protein